MIINAVIKFWAQKVHEMCKCVPKHSTRTEYCNADVPVYVSCYFVTSNIGGTRCGKRK